MRLFGPWLKATSKEFLRFLDSPPLVMQESKNFLKENLQFLEESNYDNCQPFKLALAKEQHQNDLSQMVVPLINYDEVVC